MAFFMRARRFVYGLCTILSIATLVIFSYLTRRWLASEFAAQPFQILSLCLSVLSLVVFPGMLLVSATRKNAYILYIISELGIAALMCVLWIVGASQSISEKSLIDIEIDLFIACGFSDRCASLLSAVRGTQISIFVLLLFYTLALLSYALYTHLYRGNGHVWLQTVEDLKDFRLPALTHKPKESDGRFMDGK
ncbi:hypothetical protein HYPSUDRAFT_77178 [Hypholoma sublateritium FD-334 SS-4]|uniref:MARVEL domain-containing protein n=1 Tax=Hypholoma sublateritium (strain FD-334 SS-4) TaxID=945553 RepID=A0A0D2P2Q7_HYPSF|nr:hypothetical protein HYPSUDRAFT_77178 [Hypholoma sublateritium FD-334 SS-4]